MRTTSGENVETLLNTRSFQAHSKICIQLMNIVESIMRILPNIEEARPRCSSGIESLCSLHNSIEKARLLLQHCSECSKLYLAVTGDTVLTRCLKAKKSLEQSLIPIQGMVPVLLAVEVSRIIDDLECATFVLDYAEEEAGKVLTELLQHGNSNSDSVEDFELKALQFAAPRLNITSQKALLFERRAIKKLLDKIGQSDLKKWKILRYLMYLLKKHGNYMVAGEHIENFYSRREEIARDNSSRNSLRSNRVESERSMNFDQNRTHMNQSDRVTPPEEYKCPISLRLMYDPVIIASGVTYERMWIRKWINEGKTTCPKTKMELTHTTLTPNVAMKDIISKWCKSNGVSIPDPSRHTEDFHLMDASITSIKSLGSYFNDLNLPMDFSNMSLGSLDTSFNSDVSRVQPNHDLNLMMARSSENSQSHMQRAHVPEIHDSDLMLLPTLHDLQWDSQCKVIEDLKDHMKSNSQAILSVSAENLVEPVVRFLCNAYDLQDAKALRDGTQLLLEFVNNCRNGMADISEDTFIKLANLLDSEVIGEVLDIMEELSGDGNSKTKIAASSALTSVLKLLDSDSKEFQQKAIRTIYNLSFNSEVCPRMVSLNCIQKLLPFFKDRSVLRYCIYILKNMCDTEEGRNSIVETRGCISSIAEILDTGSNEEQQHALSVLQSLCSCSQSVDYCKLILDEEENIITTLFYISQNGNDKGKESALELIQLLKDAKDVENEDNRSSQPITNNTSGESSSHTEENRSSRKSPFLKKLGLFSKNKK
ncbi:U-box domain-containing protein 5-like [Trifolium pratense]|uniref:U-box domain-containing protein 5-like n=1 Tax=Trifolium pratense TaxID=57577 RepID=UPI001E694B3E|nr:U-box domain-containing protein 5-like [Trifolium pratense]